MPRIPEETKLERQERLLRALRAAPGGMTEAELADELGLKRRTVNNYLRELEVSGRIYREGTFWFFDPESRANQLHRLEVSPEQAMTLYLATRLLVKQNDKRNEAAESALYKLADALVGEMNVGEEIRQAARELAERPGDRSYSQVFQAVVRGYLYRRAVWMRYKPRGQRPFEVTVRPYLIEPSAIGFTTYVIGRGDPPGALRTYKLERILEARLTGDSYSIPADFPGLEILRHAWSIIHGEELVEVVLRFHPAVVDRVLETRWHPSEERYEDPDRPGYLIWRAQVADTTDMLPWIRGWGSEVEVLAPPDLREYLAGEAARLARLYGAPHSADDGEDGLYNLLFGE
ncbi:MAG TPA: WYL domain-containing transcriptional regulator [Chloroflexi bacterium]|nr:WYL domain-containing transcriptional regulator [Chloroflexota bacterium]